MILYPFIRMEDRRNFNRIRQKSFLIVNGIQGFLIDLSEDGMGISISQKPTEEEIEITLILDQTEFILMGEIAWEGWNKNYPDRLDIGMKLINPSPEYVNFVKSILTES